VKTVPQDILEVIAKHVEPKDYTQMGQVWRRQLWHCNHGETFTRIDDEVQVTDKCDCLLQDHKLLQVEEKSAFVIDPYEDLNQHQDCTYLSCHSIHSSPENNQGFRLLVVPHICSHTKLQRLDLINLQIPDLSLEFLRTCPWIKTLMLSTCVFQAETGHSFVHLEHLILRSDLPWLNLESRYLDELRLVEMYGLPKLMHVWNDCPKLEQVVAHDSGLYDSLNVIRLPLKLEISPRTTNSVGMQDIVLQTSRLEADPKLYLYHLHSLPFATSAKCAVRDVDLMTLIMQSPKLRLLDLTYYMHSEGLSVLGLCDLEHSRLEHLRLRQVNVHKIHDLVHLRYLELDVPRHMITPLDLGNLPQLETLRFVPDRHVGSMCRVVWDCPNVKHLTVPYFLLPMITFPKLETLEVFYSDVFGCMISGPLPFLPKLRRLVMYGTHPGQAQGMMTSFEGYPVQQIQWFLHQGSRERTSINALAFPNLVYFRVSKWR
jgi:hypothetical protein